MEKQMLEYDGIVSVKSRGGFQLDSQPGIWFNESKYAKGYSVPFETINRGDRVSGTYTGTAKGNWVETLELEETGASAPSPSSPSPAPSRGFTPPTAPAVLKTAPFDQERTRSILKQVTSKNATELLSNVVSMAKNLDEAKALALEFSTKLETYIMDPKIDTLATVFLDQQAITSNGNGNGHAKEVVKRGRKAIRN